MRLGHEKARRHDLEREAAFLSKVEKYQKPRHSKHCSLGLSVPFQPGMYEGKSKQEIASIVGTNIQHTFVCVSPGEKTVSAA